MIKAVESVYSQEIAKNALIFPVPACGAILEPIKGKTSLAQWQRG